MKKQCENDTDQAVALAERLDKKGLTDEADAVMELLQKMNELKAENSRLKAELDALIEKLKRSAELNREWKPEYARFCEDVIDMVYAAPTATAARGEA